MRPWDSRRSCMVGMLCEKTASRRAAQKPLSIVTVRTGTLCSLAYGEFARFRTPWSCHDGPGIVAGDCVAAPACGLLARALPAKVEIAAVESAVVTNWRRVMSFNMESSLLGCTDVCAGVARTG